MRNFLKMTEPLKSWLVKENKLNNYDSDSEKNKILNLRTPGIKPATLQLADSRSSPEQNLFSALCSPDCADWRLRCKQQVWGVKRDFTNRLPPPPSSSSAAAASSASSSSAAASKSFHEESVYLKTQLSVCVFTNVCGNEI